MNASSITVNDIYLLLKPLEFNIFWMILPVIFLFILIYLYYNEGKPSKSAFIIISIFIVVQAYYFSMFLFRMNQESKRFQGLSYEETLQTFLPSDFYDFRHFLLKQIKQEETFCFNAPDNTFHDNVRTKFQLAYYLLPNRMAKDTNRCHYLIYVSYSFVGPMDSVYSKLKIFNYNKFTENLGLYTLNNSRKNKHNE